MDLSTFVGMLLEKQDGYVPCEKLRVLARALMDGEVIVLVGAERPERAEERTGYRNVMWVGELGHAAGHSGPGDS